MLVEFSVGNYLSFKDSVTFSMVASNIAQHKDTHVFELMNYKLVKSSVIYGANASGKSNLFKAMKFARDFIISSSKETQAKEEIPVKKFLLSTETENEPSFFEFVFIQNNTKYRYGFRANKSEIVDEWLFRAKKVKETKLFERSYQDIKIYKDFKEGKDLEPKTRPNALFLSVAAQFNGQISGAIIEWIENLFVISGLSKYISITLDIIKDKELKNKFLEILKIADLSIMNFEVKPKNLSEFAQVYFNALLDSGKKIELLPEIKTFHKKYDQNNKSSSDVEFDLKENESKGTQNLFSILGPILHTLSAGKVLVVDEFDVNLHPLITRFLIKLFNSNNQNPKNAQLIFNTHDTNLLNNEIFRRDQIWFTEKDEYERTDLYSLVEYELPKGKVRADRTFAKDYLAGKYGAIPFIGASNFFCESESK